MAFNGSGLFNRIYNWVNDKNNAIKILASRMDTEMDGFATGLSTCITKDGQQTLTGNIPFSGFKATGLGNATNTADAVNAGQIQANSLIYYADTGAADAYVITPAPVIAVLGIGMSWDVKIANANLTTTPTLNVNGIGVKTVVQKDGTAFPIGGLAVGAIVNFKYDGTHMQANSAVAAAAITDATIVTTDVTTNNASSTKHGWQPKTPADATKFLNGAATPAYANVKDSDLALTDITTNNATASAHGFLPKLANTGTKYLRDDGTYQTLTSIVVQEVSTSTNAQTSLTTGIPFDNTIPQNTEGDQIMSQAITPTSSSNKLILEGVVNLGENANTDVLMMALFQDSTANAKQVGVCAAGGTIGNGAIPLYYEMTAGTTSSTTFNIRAGTTSGSACYVNKSGTADFGAIVTSWLRIRESTQ